MARTASSALRLVTTVDDDATGLQRAPSGGPIFRRALCGFAQPYLRTVQRTPRFLFSEATLLLIVSGRLDLDTGADQLSAEEPSSLILVDPNTRADLVKSPGGAEQCFRSVFLTLSAELLDAFHRTRLPAQSDHAPKGSLHRVPLNQDLRSTLDYVVESLHDHALSDERLQYRLMDLLAALDERGFRFRPADANSTTARVRVLVGQAPDQAWTAQEVGAALAMSPATLRRRLAGEDASFEDLLIEVRMHHAMMLLQTTALGMTRIAEACGYRSRPRFAERFQTYFGHPPSSVR